MGTVNVGRISVAFYRQDSWEQLLKRARENFAVYIVNLIVNFGITESFQ